MTSHDIAESMRDQLLTDLDMLLAHVWQQGWDAAVTQTPCPYIPPPDPTKCNSCGNPLNKQYPLTTPVLATESQALGVMIYVEGWLDGTFPDAGRYLREHMREMAEQMVEDDCAVEDDELTKVRTALDTIATLHAKPTVITGTSSAHLAYEDTRKALGL